MIRNAAICKRSWPTLRCRFPSSPCSSLSATPCNSVSSVSSADHINTVLWHSILVIPPQRLTNAHWFTSRARLIISLVVWPRSRLFKSLRDGQHLVPTALSPLQSSVTIGGGFWCRISMIESAQSTQTLIHHALVEDMICGVTRFKISILYLNVIFAHWSSSNDETLLIISKSR